MPLRIKTDFGAACVINPIAASAEPDPKWVHPVTPSAMPVSKILPHGAVSGCRSAAAVPGTSCPPCGRGAVWRATARQIAIYICHVSLSIPQAEVAIALPRIAATVRHSCHVVEDWRDDPAYDAFIESLSASPVSCSPVSRFTMPIEFVKNRFVSCLPFFFARQARPILCPWRRGMHSSLSAGNSGMSIFLRGAGVASGACPKAGAQLSARAEARSFLRRAIATDEESRFAASTGKRCRRNRGSGRAPAGAAQCRRIRRSRNWAP